MAETNSFGAIRRTFGFSSYRYYLAGNFCAHTGAWAQHVAVGWLTWELTQSAAWLGIIGFVQLGTPEILAPLAGALADRFDRLRALRLLLFIAFLISIVLAVMALTGVVTIEIVLGLALASGVVNSFNYPVRIAIIHGLVDRNALTSAISVNALAINLARSCGPLLAGLTIVKWGATGAFFLTASAYIAFLLTLYRVQLLTDEAPGERAPVRRIPAEILDGFRYIVRHPGIGPLLLLLAMFAILGQPYRDLMLGFIDEMTVQKSIPEKFFWAGLGETSGLFCVLFLATRIGVQGLTRILTANILIASVALICFAPDIFWLTFVGHAVVAWALTAMAIGGLVLIQASVDGAMRGRVLSLYYVTLAVAALLGKWTIGFVSTFIGMSWSFLLAAVLCLILWLWARKRQDRMAASLEAEPERGHR